MTDKTKELNSTIRLVNDRLHFFGKTEGNEPVSIDYIAPLGDNLGYTSLELLLLSLTSCIGSAVLTFLRKMNKTVTSCEIHAKGYRKEEHSTGFGHIKVDIILSSPDVADEDMKKVIRLAEEKYCPVYSMIQGNTIVDINFIISNLN